MTRQKITCFKCGEKGHIASTCPNRRITLAKQDSEDDESATEEDKQLEVHADTTGELLLCQIKKHVPPPNDDWKRNSVFHTSSLLWAALHFDS